MDFSNDSFEESGSSVFSISSLDTASTSNDSLEVSFSFSEDSLPIFNFSPDVSFSTKGYLDQSFSHDPLMVINSGDVSQGRKQLVFDLPDFFQPPCTSEKVATFTTPTATAMLETISLAIIQSLSFTGTLGVFSAKCINVQRVTMASKLDTAFVFNAASSSFMVLGISPNHVAAFALEYNINSMILSSRILIPFQFKENEPQVTQLSLIPHCKGLRSSTNNNMVHLYPKVFTTNSAGVLKRIDVNIRSSTNTSIKNNNPAVLDVRDVQINDHQIEVLETCSVKYTTRKPKKNIVRRFARWFRKRSSVLKCF